jgi:hypothetical protein
LWESGIRAPLFKISPHDRLTAHSDAALRWDQLAARIARKVPGVQHAERQSERITALSGVSIRQKEF